MRRALLVAGAAAALAGSAPEARAAFSNDFAGTSSGQFLKLPVDARGAAMGGAMGAAAGDASALHWNPAGLSGSATRKLTFTGVPRHLDGGYYGFLGFVQPLESLVARPRRELAPTGLGALAIGITYLNAGTISERDNTGKSTGGSFTPTDLAAAAGWGGAVNRVLDLGVAVKVIRSQIHANASTASGDFGARLKLRAGPVPVAFSASGHNLFGGLKFRDQLDPLPTTVRFAVAAEVLPVLLTTFDLVAPRDARPYPCFGAEILAPVERRLTLAGRFGFNGIVSGGQTEGTAGFTLGGGITLLRASFDYAWQPYGTLGDSHRLTFSFRF